MIKNEILILEGGYNEEHEVSLKSSIFIQKILNKLKISYKIMRVNPTNFEKKIVNYKNMICFNALHGPFGEDGKIQKILKKNRIKFTHSGYKSSKICFDKVTTKKILSKNGILTPEFNVLSIKDLNEKVILKLKEKYNQFVIKPKSSGSSYGTIIIKNEKDVKDFIKKILNYKKSNKKHKEFLVEKFISGKELTVSTLQTSKKIKSLAVTEIKTDNTFFDYQAKYSKGYAKHILPAKLSKKNYSKCLNLAMRAHKLLGCKSVARSDFIYNKKTNRIYFLEINTQPGLTSISLLPEQAKFKNISFEKVILSILKNLN